MAKADCDLNKTTENVIPRPSSEALAILSALRALEFICDVRQRLALREQSVVEFRAWCAAQGIIDNAARMLLERVGVPQ